MATYGIDPEEELANTASYQDAMAGMAPTAAPSPIVDPWQTDVSPEAVGSPVVDPFAAGTPAPGLAPAPVVAPPEAVSAKVSESAPVALPKYAQVGTPTTGTDAYAQIAGAKDPAVAAGRATAGILANDKAAAADLLGQYSDVYQGEAGVERDAAIEVSRLAEQRAAEIRQMKVEAENQIRTSDDEIREIASVEPDPGRFWSSRTSGQKALYYITAALQAFSKPDEVPKVAELLLKFVDDDIGRQEDRMKRELDAAKGRGASVREMIVAGKSDAEAIHGQRTLRFEAMKRGAMAKWVAAGKTAAATEEYNKTIAGIGAAEAKSFDDTARMTLQQREQIAAQRARAAELAYRKQRDRQEDAAKAAAGAGAVDAIPFQGSKVYRRTPDGKLEQLYGEGGSALDYVPLNKAVPDSVVTEVSKKALAQQRLTQSSARMYRYLDKAGGVADLITDKQYVDFARDFAVDLRNAKEVGVMTDQDIDRQLVRLGLRLMPDGVGITTVADLQVSPKTVREAVGQTDEMAAKDVEAGFYMITQPGSGLVMRPKTGADVYQEMKTQEEGAERAKRDQLTGELTGYSPAPGGVKRNVVEAPAGSDPLVAKAARSAPNPGLDKFISEAIDGSRGDRTEVIRTIDMALESADPASGEYRRLAATRKVLEETPAKAVPRTYRGLLQKVDFGGKRSQAYDKAYDEAMGRDVRGQDYIEIQD